MGSPPILRAFQWDLARQVERLDVLLSLIPKYAEWGFQELYVHLEDAIEYPSFPEIARQDAFGYRQFGKLVKTAGRYGIGVVPIVNLLGHTQYLIKTPGLRELNELRGPDGGPLESGQICPLHARTLEVAGRLIDDVRPFCTAGKVHVGLDESFRLGRCPRCRKEIARMGLAAHFAGHAQRLHALAATRGLRLGMWADMLALLPEAIPLLPAGVAAYDWYYYPFKRRPRVELYNFAEYELAPALRAQGVAYWGCPMNGVFRYEPLPIFSDRLANLRSWWRRCRQTRAEGYLITSWEPYRMAFELNAVVDAAAASFWLEGDEAVELTDLELLARGFSRAFGRSGARSSARAALQADRYPFSGYARWDLNDRWDVSALPTPIAKAEAGCFRALQAAARKLPKPLSASLGFRSYLAGREAFVASAQECVRRLRRTNPGSAQRQRLLRAQLAAGIHFLNIAVPTGRARAREAWRRTRPAAIAGPNEQIVQADRQRAKAWVTWLRTCLRQPAHVGRASTVYGAAQLHFEVINFAPAVQRVSVEQGDSGGGWRLLHARYTIDFQAAAARRRTQRRAAFSVPIDGLPTDREGAAPSDLPVKLRIAVGGVGQVRIASIELDQGETVRRGWLKHTILGNPAQHKGWPEVEAPPAAEEIVWAERNPPPKEGRSAL